MTSKVLKNKKQLRSKRKVRVRSRCSGTSDKPRISVFRSNRYFYAQAIDDHAGATLVSINGGKMQLGNDRFSVEKIGEEFARLLLSSGIKEAVFDRNGYLYHGVVAAFADSLRKGGVAL